MAELADEEAHDLAVGSWVWTLIPVPALIAQHNAYYAWNDNHRRITWRVTRNPFTELTLKTNFTF